MMKLSILLGFLLLLSGCLHQPHPCGSVDLIRHEEDCFHQAPGEIIDDNLNNGHTIQPNDLQSGSQILWPAFVPAR